MRHDKLNMSGASFRTDLDSIWTSSASTFRK